MLQHAWACPFPHTLESLRSLGTGVFDGVAEGMTEGITEGVSDPGTTEDGSDPGITEDGSEPGSRSEGSDPGIREPIGTAKTVAAAEITARTVNCMLTVWVGC